MSVSIFFDGNLETAVLDREKIRGESEDLWERFRDDRFLFFSFFSISLVGQQIDINRELIMIDRTARRLGSFRLLNALERVDLVTA